MATSSIQQLVAIKNSMATRHQPAHPSGEQFQPPAAEIPALTPKSKSRWNILQRLRQIKNEGRSESKLHSDRLRNFEEIQKYENEIEIRKAKHAIDCMGLADDDAVVKRGADQINESGVKLMIRTSDALQIVAEIADQKVSSAEAIKNQQIRAKHVQEIILSHARQATDIRAAAYGFKYDLDRSREEDN